MPCLGESVAMKRPGAGKPIPSLRRRKAPKGDKRGVTRRKAQAGPPDSARPTRGQDEAAGNGGGGPEQC